MRYINMMEVWGKYDEIMMKAWDKYDENMSSLTILESIQSTLIN